MKLYIFNNGTINVPTKSHMVPGRGLDPLTIPVLTFLIEHPEGLVLVDTGMNPGVWPEHMKDNGIMKQEQRVDVKLAEIGYRPEDINYVFLSHLHLDHCGWISLFPEARFIVRKEEMKDAWWPEDRSPGAGGYVFSDYQASRDFDFLELPDNEDHDIFGDGKLISIDTKGHTRGHQSLVVNLPLAGSLVLAIDATSLAENYSDKIPPGEGIWSAEWGLKSIEKFRDLEKKGTRIIFGHDPDQAKTLKYAPLFYE